LSYEIKLPQFEGPFDLLLFFIQRDELDIYDIPVAKITDDFLEYLRHMEEQSLEIASEFILMAATLMKIKARMLLPRWEKDEEGNEIDPRQELVDRLLEYKRFKEAAEDLRKLEEVRQKKTNRGNVQSELRQLAEKYTAETDLSYLTLYKLLKAFEQVMEKAREREVSVHHVTRYSYSVENERERIISRLEHADRLGFEDLFSQAESKIHAIFIFLALLDAIHQQTVSIRVGKGMNNFWISKGKKYGEAAEA